MLLLTGAWLHAKIKLVLSTGFDYRYLALVAALTSEADYVFIPESPPPDDWQKRLCDKLEQVEMPVEA